MKLYYYLLTILFMYSHSLHAQQAQKQDQYKKILMPVIIGSTCLTAIAALVGTIWFIKKRQDRYRPIHSIKSRNNSQKQQQESWSHNEDDELSQVAHIYIMHPAQSPDVATVHSLECSISCIYNAGNQPPIQWEKPEERRYVESLCRQQRPVALLCNVNKNVLKIISYDPCPANTWNRKQSDVIALQAGKEAGWQVR